MQATLSAHKCAVKEWGFVGMTAHPPVTFFEGAQGAC